MCMRGDIYYVDFGEGDGSKQGGTAAGTYREQ